MRREHCLTFYLQGIEGKNNDTLILKTHHRQQLVLVSTNLHRNRCMQPTEASVNTNDHFENHIIGYISKGVLSVQSVFQKIPMIFI